jgi:hypothetical protein
VRRSLGSCLGLQLRIHLRRCLMSSGSALPRGHEHRPVPHVPARRFPHIAWESQTAISRYPRLSCDCFANESQGLLGVRVGAEGPMLTPEERQGAVQMSRRIVILQVSCNNGASYRG